MINNKKLNKKDIDKLQKSISSMGFSICISVRHRIKSSFMLIALHSIILTNEALIATLNKTL